MESKDDEEIVSEDTVHKFVYVPKPTTKIFIVAIYVDIKGQDIIINYISQDANVFKRIIVGPTIDDNLMNEIKSIKKIFYKNIRVYLKRLDNNISVEDIKKVCDLLDNPSTKMVIFINDNSKLPFA